MKIGEETICYQHQQAQNILEKLLKRGFSDNFDASSNSVKEAIEWVTYANDSAVRMEDKLKEYKKENTQLKASLENYKNMFLAG